VVTGPELAGWHDVEPWLGPAFKDQPVLAIDRVRYFGEPLAVVVAGFIAPAASGQLHAGWQAVTTLAWIGFGTALHVTGQLVLGRLRH